MGGEEGKRRAGAVCGERFMPNWGLDEAVWSTAKDKTWVF